MKPPTLEELFVATRSPDAAQRANVALALPSLTEPMKPPLLPPLVPVTKTSASQSANVAG